MLKLKLQYFGHLVQRADSLEKTLMLGKIEGRGRRGWQKTRLLDGITSSMDMNSGKLWGLEGDGEAWRAAAHGVSKSWTQLGDWTTTTSPQGIKMLYLGEHHSLRCIPASCLYTGSHAWEACNSSCSTGQTRRGMGRVIREVSLEPSDPGFVAGPFHSKLNWRLRK